MGIPPLNPAITFGNTNMIPTYPSSAERLRSDPTVREIAVRGYSRGCGKTALACTLAAALAKQYTKVQVVTVFGSGSDGVEMQRYLVNALGYSATAFDINEIAQPGYDATVYDIDDAVHVDETYYIAPKLLEDPLLGVQDSAGQKFRQSVAEALATRLGTIQLTFIDEGEPTTNSSIRWLAATDWMVLRELERLHLADTALGTLRNYIRNTDLNSWEPGIRI